MYDVSENFVLYSRQHGREQELKLILNDYIFESDDIRRIEKSFDGDLFRTVMQELKGEVKGKHDLTNQAINFSYGLSYKGSPTEWVDYGNFIVKEHERIIVSATENKTTFLAYDLMLNTHTLYDIDVLDITYPISIYELYKAIGIACNVHVTETSIPNGSQIVEEDKWTNIEDVTYRNVLDEIAEITGTTIMINDNKLMCKEIIFNDLITPKNSIDENNMRSLKIHDKVLPFNILNLTREQAHDNYVYPFNWEDIPKNERSEIVFADNSIMDKDRERYAPVVYEQIKDIEYYPFESQPRGTLHFQPLDFINVVDMNNVNHNSLVSTQTLVFTTGISENIKSLVTKSHKEKYVLVTDNKRQFMRVYFLVDQQNGIIEALVNRVDDIAEEQASLRIEVDKIGLQVSQIHNGNIIDNLNGLAWYTNWRGGSMARYVYENLNPPIPLQFQDLKYNIGFVIMDDPTSLNGKKMSIYEDGYDISPLGFIALDGNVEYSYRAKMVKFKPFNIEVLEYEEVEGTITKRTRFTFNNPQAYIQFTLDLQEETHYVALQYNRVGVSPSDRIEISEQMFNRGQPKEWFENATDVKVWAQSQINLLDSSIELNSSLIDSVRGDIHNAGVEINAVVGVETYGKKFSVKSEDRTQTYLEVTENGIIGEHLSVKSGDVGGFIIGGDELLGTRVALRPEEIEVGKVKITNTEDSNVLKIETIGIDVIAPEGGSTFSGYRAGGQRVAFYNRNAGVLSLFATNIRAVHSEFSVGIIGLPDERFNTIYLKNQPDIGSDSRYKQNILPIDDLMLKHASRLKAKTYTLKGDDKIHFGYLAQDVQAMIYNYYYEKNISLGKLESSRLAMQEVENYAMLSRSESYMSLIYGEIEVLKTAYIEKEMQRLNSMIDDSKEKSMTREIEVNKKFKDFEKRFEKLERNQV